MTFKNAFCTGTISILFFISSCDKPFDKTHWNDGNAYDVGIPGRNRSLMLQDLITKTKLVGLKYDELRNLLGKPERVDSAGVPYDIVVDYGRDIDPVYLKYLKLKFSKDSVVSKFNVIEWKK